MLALNKSTEYALTALQYLAEREDACICAREIAEANGLPLPLLMNLMKVLHQKKVVRSTRGVKGGYRIAADLDAVSLYDLVVILQEDGREGRTRVPNAAPLQALHYKMTRFLKDVMLSDLVIPGRRIDVPVERVRLLERV